jgi:hypothetical protein
MSTTDSLPNTPKKPTNTRHKHYKTPQEAKMQDACEFLEVKQFPFSKEEVFDHFNIDMSRPLAEPSLLLKLAERF